MPPTVRRPSRSHLQIWEAMRCPRRRPSASQPLAVSACCRSGSRPGSPPGRRSSDRRRSSRSWSRTRSMLERPPCASTFAAAGSISSGSATMVAAFAPPISGSPASATPPASIRPRGSARCAPSASAARRCRASPVWPSSILSRRPAPAAGWRLTLRGGRVLRDEPAPRPVGTTVTVRGLFADLPARRSTFTGNGARGETTQIAATVRRLALAAPGVRFSLHVEDRLALQTSGSDDLLSTLAETHGHALSGSLVALGPVEAAGATIQGAIAGAEVTRPGRSGVTLLVNGRPVYGRGLQSALEAAYRPLLPRGRHPVLLLAIEVDPRRVDVNVHPAKLEVRLRDEREIAAAMAELGPGCARSPPVAIALGAARRRGGPGPRRRNVARRDTEPLGRRLADRHPGVAAGAPDRPGRRATPAAGRGRRTLSRRSAPRPRAHPLRADARRPCAGRWGESGRGTGGAARAAAGRSHSPPGPGARAATRRVGCARVRAGGVRRARLPPAIRARLTRSPAGRRR